MCVKLLLMTQRYMLLVASSVGAGGAAAGGNKIHARLTPNEKQNWRALSIQCGCVVRVFVVVAGCARVLLNRLNDDGSTTYLHTYKYRTHTHTHTQCCHFLSAVVFVFHLNACTKMSHKKIPNDSFDSFYLINLESIFICNPC